MKTAFVTGATGLLGNNLVRQLLDQGWHVKAMARSNAKAEHTLGNTQAEIVIGDMENVPAIVDDLAGVDTLFHTAAYFREYYQPGEHWEILKRINIDATIALLAAAEKQNVRRVVHTSSAGVLPLSRKGALITEEDGYVEDTPNLYFRSKVLLEQQIQSFLHDSALDVVMVLPGWMHGPGDYAPTSAGQIVLGFLKKSCRLFLTAANQSWMCGMLHWR